jgi:O-antigen/teichoic acid export membrane protein
MTVVDKSFWRGYWPLLSALGVAQLTQQADIVMVARLGGGASGAYVMLTRMAIVDIVLMAAIGAVASTLIAQAERSGETPRVTVEVLIVAAATGLCCCAFGLAFYPGLIGWLSDDAEIAGPLGVSVFWFALAAPFRFFSSTAAFVLHALADGPRVVRWRLIEAMTKIAGNFLFMNVLGWGFAGCFVSGSLVAILSSIWCWRVLARRSELSLVVPERAWTLRFLRSTAWESQRILTIQAAIFVCLALFAAPWLGTYEVARINSYAAGQTLILFVFAPFMALMRYLAYRLPELNGREFDPIVKALWRHGAIVVFPFAAALIACKDQLGGLYGQQGPWWSVFIEALAVSLPLRYATNVLRAVSQARGDFNAVAKADSASLWIFGVPLVALGLHLDAPAIAYLSLIVPEAACGLWLWRRLQGAEMRRAWTMFETLRALAGARVELWRTIWSRATK